MLDALAALSRSDLAVRSAITQVDDPSFLPSECILHFLRHCRFDNSDRQFESLFRILRQRVLARVPRAVLGLDADGREILSGVNLRIAELVLDRFQELLMLDRATYDDRLDYFEVNFDDAIASLRSTSRRKADREENRSEPMTYDDDTSELNAEIEKAAAAQNPISESKLDDPAYRLRLDAAIDALPVNLRRVVELLRQGIPIDPEDPDTPSIVKILGCVEKTVRNRRDRAFEELRKALKEEET